MSITKHEARSIIRKGVKRVPEGEAIRHLNIMPMMDMMTILLVAFIFQMATSALELTAGTVELPRTTTDALRNFGDQAGQSTVNLTGSQTAGKVVGTIGKIAGAVPAAPVLVGSAAVGAGKYLYGKARNLFGLKDG